MMTRRWTTMAALAFLLTACGADAQTPTGRPKQQQQPVAVKQVPVQVETAPAKGVKIEWSGDLGGKRYYNVTFDAKPQIGASGHVHGLLKALAAADGTNLDGASGSEPTTDAKTRRYYLGYAKTGGRATVSSAKLTNQLAGTMTYVVVYTAEPKITDVNALAEAIAAFEKSYFEDTGIKHEAKVSVDPRKPREITITVTLKGGKRDYLKNLRGETGNLP